jgi:hypothetical protein
MEERQELESLRQNIREYRDIEGNNDDEHNSDVEEVNIYLMIIYFIFRLMMI